MSGVLDNLIDPFIDIGGVDTADQTKTLADENSGIGDSVQTGTGDSLSAPVSDEQTLTDAGATFVVADVGRFIVISGATNGGNNGTFLITEFVSSTSIKILNSSGVLETSSFSWDVREPYMIGDDINFERTDRKLIKGTTNYYDAIPTYERPDAIGTDVDANLTNLAGKTADALTTVRNVKQEGIYLRPSITDGDATLAIADETFTTTNYHFTSDDLNSFITISGSTDADGTYRIKTVTSGNTLELDGLNSATAEGSITWVLEGDLKGILSSRGYADAVNRIGLPIADSGAYDETKYNNTYTEVINGVVGGSPEEEDGDNIFARMFGDEKDPNNTTTNEGTRFFVQLVTGDNDGTATDSVLESISGRSGSAASLAGSNTNVSGLSGMVEQDIGRYLTIWNLAADEAGHYLITDVVSATEVTVSRGSNFTADASGAINWQVSRHPDTWDFYNGDRYRNDQIDEAWARTLLVGGVVSSSELTGAIDDLREFVGAAAGDTTPGLTNTGNYYTFSDLGNPADTSLEEAVNIINQEIGDRDYSATAIAGVSGLADGQTITESIEAIALAVGASSAVRTIERLSAAIPKNTAYTIPVTYTLDGTSNGRNLWVYVRGILQDPGLPINGDDYEETSTTQLTFYKLVSSGDHINYFLLQ